MKRFYLTNMECRLVAKLIDNEIKTLQEENECFSRSLEEDIDMSFTREAFIRQCIEYNEFRIDTLNSLKETFRCK